MKGYFIVCFTCLVTVSVGSVLPYENILEDNAGIESPADGLSDSDTFIEDSPSVWHPAVFYYPNEFESYDDNDDTIDDEESSEDILIRNKRQARDLAMDLALSHQDRNGNDRAVGKIHGRVDLNAIGNDARNYHAQGGVGAGSVLWRSKNNRHSVGVGAYAEQHRGRFQGYRYKSRPNFGAGVGYRFRF